MSTSLITRLSEIDDAQRKFDIERRLTLEKAFSSQDVETIFKAQNYYSKFVQQNNPMARQPSGVKAMIIDPNEISSSMGYYQKSTNIAYSTLRQMAKAPIIRSIISTRQDQVAEFCRPQLNKHSKGFVIEKVGQDQKKDVTDSDKRQIDALTKFLLQGGEEENNWKWDDFETTARKFINDSLVLDQGCIEIIPQRNFEPHSFIAVDGATMRIAGSYDDISNVEGKKKVLGSYPSYCQIWQGNIIREFYPWEMVFGIRNPTTNILMNGYGRGELEDLVITITSMLNADTYNGNFFRQGSMPKGMLMVKNAQGLNGDRLKELQRNWNAMVAGTTNAHKTPVLDADSIEYLDLQKNNRDMEFMKFLEYLIKVACAMFKISPEEIGFPLEGQGKGMGGGDNGKEEKKYSMSKGLNPLLTYFEKVINKYIIGPKTNYEYVFKFVGMEVESAQEEEERLLKAAEVYITPNEIRTDKGLKTIKNALMDLPVNPIFAQQQQMQQQQQQQDSEQQQQQEDDDFANTNPFMKAQDNPMEKALTTWMERELFNNAA